MSKSAVIQTIKICISLFLLFFTLQMIDWQNSLALACRAKACWIFTAAGLLMLERILSVAKWLLLLKSKGATVTFWRLFVINYIGGFWGLVLPSSVSADIARGYYLSKTTANASLAVSSMLVDRLMGALSLVGLGCLSALIAGDTFGLTHTRWLACALLALCTAGAALLLHRHFPSWMDRRLSERLKRIRIFALARHWVASCFTYRHYPRILAWSLVLSALVQIMRVLVFYAVALAFDVHVPVGYYFIFIPLIMLLIMLPISINGIGVREGAFTGFFALVGVPAPEAFVISFAVSVLTTLMTAAGGLFYMLDRGLSISARTPQK